MFCLTPHFIEVNVTIRMQPHLHTHICLSTRSRFYQKIVFVWWFFFFVYQRLCAQKHRNRSQYNDKRDILILHCYEIQHNIEYTEVNTLIKYVIFQMSPINTPKLYRVTQAICSKCFKFKNKEESNEKQQEGFFGRLLLIPIEWILLFMFLLLKK